MALRWLLLFAVFSTKSSSGLSSKELLCQTYTGETCAGYLQNHTVFVAPELTMELIEERLKAAYGVIKESK